MHNHITIFDEISNFALHYAHWSAEKSVTINFIII